MDKQSTVWKHLSKLVPSNNWLIPLQVSFSQLLDLKTTSDKTNVGRFTWIGTPTSSGMIARPNFVNGENTRPMRFHLLEYELVRNSTDFQI